MLFLKNLNISIPIKSNFVIFISSFSLSATPGQVGELIKSQLLKNRFNIPISKTAPLVFVERLYDLIGALVVSILGIWFLENGALVVGVMSTVLLFIFLLIRSRKTFTKISFLLNKLPFLRGKLDNFPTIYESINPCVSKKMLFYASTFSVIYWLLIGASAYFVLVGLGIDAINLINMISIYSSSLILGAVSLIPGGIGVAEGSIASLLTLGGVDISVALVIGILIRIFTLWFGVSLGVIFLKISGGLKN